jgi:hypothetical protein
MLAIEAAGCSAIFEDAELEEVLAWFSARTTSTLAIAMSKSTGTTATRSAGPRPITM